MIQQNFRGFEPEALIFLREVRQTNSKAWYEANKPEYQRLLLRPFQDLVADLSGPMLEIDPELITKPAVDKTISRIYRDTRFSKDKLLYRDAIWLSFKRPCLDWKEAPTYFFEITPQWYRYGMGFYNTPKGFMDKFRELLIRQPEPFLEALAPVQAAKIFSAEGERYKKPSKLECSPEVREWLQFKNFFFTTGQLEIDARLFETSLVERLLAGFQNLAPVYHYLWEIKQLVEQENQAGEAGITGD